MSREENLALIERFIDEVKNKGSVAAIDELVAANIVHHFPIPGLTEGRQGIKEVGMNLRTSFPDVTVMVEFLLCDGDKVVERSMAQATHKGEFMGIPATNKTVGWTETHIYKIGNGQIVEQWSELNMLGVMHQLQH